MTREDDDTEALLRERRYTHPPPPPQWRAQTARTLDPPEFHSLSMDSPTQPSVVVSPVVLDQRYADAANHSSRIVMLAAFGGVLLFAAGVVVGALLVRFA